MLEIEILTHSDAISNVMSGCHTLLKGKKFDKWLSHPFERLSLP